MLTRKGGVGLVLSSGAAALQQRVRLFATIVFFGGCLAATAAAAAAAPAPPIAPSLDPGAILQNQLQNELNNRPGPPPAPEAAPPVLEIPPLPMLPPLVAPGVMFQLNGITVDPSAFLTPQDLAAIYQPYIGKEVGFDDLQKIVEQINALYRARGVATALAVLPPQRVENGTVHIQLVEGKVGNIKIEGANLTRPSYIEQRLGTEPGAVINTDALAQALIRFNRTHQTQLQASLQPGASLGLTDILVRATEPMHYELQAFADNLAVNSVGRYEGGIFLRDAEPLHIGDRLDLYVVGSAGTVTGDAVYSIPVENSLFELSYARGLIDIAGAATPPGSGTQSSGNQQTAGNTNASAGGQQQGSITGHSQTISINFLQPLLVNQEWRVDGAASFAHDESASAVAGSPVTDNFTNKPAIGTRVEEITPMRYLLLTGTVAYERSEGVPGLSWATVGNGTVTAIQQLPQPLAPLSLDFKGGWQVSSKPKLAPAELMQLGGFSTIRGYVQAALSGTSAYYLQSEIHRPLTPELDAFAFFDVGATFAGPVGSLLARGTGLGLIWNWRFLSLTTVGSYGIDEKRVAPHNTPYQLYFRLATHYAF
jgi:hemolysin activation/secretion protein